MSLIIPNLALKNAIKQLSVLKLLDHILSSRLSLTDLSSSFSLYVILRSLLMIFISPLKHLWSFSIIHLIHLIFSSMLASLYQPIMCSCLQLPLMLHLLDPIHVELFHSIVLNSQLPYLYPLPYPPSAI